MKKLNILSLVLVLTCVTALSALNGIAQDSKVSVTLPETVEWLKGKTDEIVDIYSIAPRSNPAIPVVREWEISNSDGCRITFRKINPKSVTPSERTKRRQPPTMPPIGLEGMPPSAPSQMSVIVSFADLNPYNIDIDGTEPRPETGLGTTSGSGQLWRINLYPTDRSKVVKWQLDNSGFESSDLRIVVKDREMAQRLRNALKHAITRCEGKKDKEEPF